MQAESVVEFAQGLRGKGAYGRADAFDRDGADLFGLSLGVDPQPGEPTSEKDLERVDVIDT